MPHVELEQTTALDALGQTASDLMLLPAGRLVWASARNGPDSGTPLHAVSATVYLVPADGVPVQLAPTRTLNDRPSTTVGGPLDMVVHEGDALQIIAINALQVEDRSLQLTARVVTP